jgi:hypothetical protein
MRNFSKIAVGFITITVLSSLLTKGAALVIILASLICTAGVSLVIWVPVSYGVGAAIFWLAGSFFGKPQPVKLEKPPTKEEIALANYAKQARENGLTEDKIFLRLREKGWNEDIIRKVL